jgi:hypothetical protein
MYTQKSASINTQQHKYPFHFDFLIISEINLTIALKGRKAISMELAFNSIFSSNLSALIAPNEHFLRLIYGFMHRFMNFTDINFFHYKNENIPRIFLRRRIFIP